MSIAPAAISAEPAVMMTRVDSTAPDRPAARAKGTVSPSDIPITMSRIVSEAVKCFSTCGVWGTGDLRLGAGGAGGPPPRAGGLFRGGLAQPRTPRGGGGLWALALGGGGGGGRSCAGAGRGGAGGGG